jgi:hypothetical protein
VAVVTRRTICSFVSQRSGSVAIGPTDSRLLADAFCASGPNLSCPDSVCVGGDQCPYKSRSSGSHCRDLRVNRRCPNSRHAHNSRNILHSIPLLTALLNLPNERCMSLSLVMRFRAASHLQDLIAAWGVSAAREAAWDKCRIALALAPNPAA